MAEGRDRVTIGTTPVELVDLEPPPDGANGVEDEAAGNDPDGRRERSRAAYERSHHGALHAAINEDDPAAQGAEIR
jgi:hypothetical protein